jgi:hypothetical protein
MHIRATQFCTSNQPYATAYVMSHTTFGEVYELLIPFPGAEPSDFSCTCKGFKHRGHCSHQREVALCHWNDLDGEPQTEEGVCPRCGLDTYEESIMVDHE